MDLGLEGMSILITGGSAGIGLLAAERCAREGGKVAVVGRDAERLDEAVKSLYDLGAAAACAVQADLAEPAAAGMAVERAVAEHGPIDILVNNVGLATQRTFEEVSDAEWQQLWDLNVMSYVRTIRAVVPSMVERGGGSIVNVSSTAGKRPSAGMAHYSVTKAAVQSLSRLVADTYAKHGIRSNAICPGPALTPAWLADGGLGDQVAQRKGITRDEALAATGAGRPLGRMAEPAEIADAIVFLASPRSSYTTGAAWSVDGGSVPVII